MIHVTNLQFQYGRRQIYDGLSMSLSQPGVYGLFGRNGSGKSTLLKLLAGLLFPQQGGIQVLGFSPAQRHPDFLQQIYVVPEEFHLPSITLSTLLATHGPFYPHFSVDDFASHVDAFELPMTVRFDAMSLGQKKKSVLAFALATHTPVLLMDEPTNGLDIMGRTQFKAAMAQADHQKRCVMISTHQAHDLESLMQHALFIDAGRLELAANMHNLQAALRMGVAERGQLPTNTLYLEAMGAQWAYVAEQTNAELNPPPIHIELLYKALSVNKAAVIAAIDRHNVTRGYL